jgi:hypothetical protein
MYPSLYQKAKETITNMTRADYLFLISYPNYSGYRIEHDPVCTIYFTPVIVTPPNLGGLVVIVAAAGVAIAAAAIILKRRGKKLPTPV